MHGIGIFMDFRLFRHILLVVILFRLRNQNFEMSVSNVSLEVGNDNDLSWLMQSSPKKQKTVSKKSG